MADKIKKFFQKKKSDAKFRMAGPGHKLTDEQPERSRSTSSSSKQSQAPSRTAPSAEARQAAEAALSRLGGSSKPNTAAFNTSLAAIQMQVKRELENERKAAASSSTNQSESSQEKSEDIQESQYLAVKGVYFTCPLISAEVLSKDEWHVKIREFLYEQLEEELGLTACLIIHSCNKNKEKVRLCVETLCKYLENIIKNPTEEKFRKIRISNRIFQERVKPVEGSAELLRAAGFIECKQAVSDGEEEDFYVFSEERLQSEDSLEILCDALQSAEPITLELDRNLQVLLPSQAAKRNELPPTFFSLSPEEIKKEQQIREEVLEKNLMLRTKAMREKEEQRELRKYRFALIRVRFPDGVLLQGTFTVFEKLSNVFEFVRVNLAEEEMSFVLCSPTGHKLGEEEMDQSLLDLRLIPATILIFSPEAVNVKQPQNMFLKPEVMMLVQSM